MKLTCSLQNHLHSDLGLFWWGLQEQDKQLNNDGHMKRTKEMINGLLQGELNYFSLWMCESNI